MSEKKKYGYGKPSIDKNLYDIIQQFIEEYPDYGYGSVNNFIEDAIRRRAEELRIFELTPRFSHFNVYENRITILDKKLGFDDEKGKRHPKMIDVYFKPVGEFNEYVLWCEYCGREDCEHVKYALTIHEKFEKQIKAKGWKYVGPIF
jgi:hypothetical protein